ncbi:MAG: preprotein translocase subunit YajC [Planctomycetes bacterium]|jgi:preprotein translocase subunit YajC|nr:preprotein translocase subunit YajC [Planctomycetota bacterium]
MNAHSIYFLSWGLGYGVDATGEGGNDSGGGGASFFIPMILILGIFYVVLILPERKKQKKRQAMLDQLQKGDKVMTSSGIYGNVAAINEDIVTLQVADGVRIRFSRAAVQDIINKDTDEASAKQGGEKAVSAG